MIPISSTSTLNQVRVINPITDANNLPNSSNKITEKFLQASSSLNKQSQTNFDSLPYEMKVKVIKKSSLQTLRNLKATNSFLREMCSQPFALQATKILKNAVINLKKDLVAGDAFGVSATLEYLDLLGLLTNKEIAYFKDKKVNWNCVVDGKNLLERTIIANKPSSLKLAIKAGATVNNHHIRQAGYPTSLRGDLLSLAARYDFTGEIVEILTEKSGKLNTQNIIGESALHLAAQFKNLIAIEILVRYGANCNLVDLNNKTVLFSVISMDENHPRIVKILLEAGAKIDIVSKGGVTPLSQAVMQSAKENRTANLVAILDYEDTFNQSIDTTLKAYSIAKELKHLPTMNFLEERMKTSPYKYVQICTIQ